MGNQVSINEKAKPTINIKFVYDDVKFSNIEKIDGINFEEECIKNLDEFELNDFEGYPLNGSYQNILNILYHHQNENTFYVRENFDILEMGYITSGRLYVIECENLKSQFLNANAISNTIKYIINNDDYISDDIPKCIRKIFERKIKSSIDFMRPIEDSDKIVIN